ncbi:MAG: hypothetical protein WAK55_06690 [Xanthobacteraceae bacterium]
MAKRKNFHRRSHAVGFVDGTKLGSHSLIYDDNEVIRMLTAAIERDGNQVTFARRHGIERANLNRILKGKRPVSDTVLKTIGPRKVYAPE